MLATLIPAWAASASAMTFCARRVISSAARRVKVSSSIRSGGTLSEAMARHAKMFDRLYINMIKAGEAGGVLDLILARLADFMEKAAKLKKKVIGAMIYPAVVISIAVASAAMAFGTSSIAR